MFSSCGASFESRHCTRPSSVTPLKGGTGGGCSAHTRNAPNTLCTSSPCSEMAFSISGVSKSRRRKAGCFRARRAMLRGGAVAGLAETPSTALGKGGKASTFKGRGAGCSAAHSSMMRSMRICRALLLNALGHTEPRAVTMSFMSSNCRLAHARRWPKPNPCRSSWNLSKAPGRFAKRARAISNSSFSSCLFMIAPLQVQPSQKVPQQAGEGVPLFGQVSKLAYLGQNCSGVYRGHAQAQAHCVQNLVQRVNRRITVFAQCAK
ncbi:hypothetical protein SAMN05428957_106199 [Oryzisolibacter propanilivorax]|uniref:Uncharacterized protein n=1 Tax=Oryzisolibacter propanilivorax TaxID=1527607 RepID=A0A1G9TKU3_9BURK|nr:hypothetical protein SAMN05428957_106199 [Oryzisolibacter propanilivorax]